MNKRILLALLLILQSGLYSIPSANLLANAKRILWEYSWTHRDRDLSLALHSLEAFERVHPIPSDLEVDISHIDRLEISDTRKAGKHIALLLLQLLEIDPELQDYTPELYLFKGGYKSDKFCTKKQRPDGFAQDDLLGISQMIFTLQ